MLVIIYLLEDEQELSLGILIRPKRNYNFCLLHACFGWYFYAFDTLSYTFDHIWIILLTRCTTVSVPVFCCLFISAFPLIKSAPKIPEKSNKKISAKEPSRASKGSQRGATRALGALVARPGARPRQVATWTLWPIFTPSSETLKDRTLFRDLPSVLPPPRFQDRGYQETLSRHLVGGRIELRELLHHHERFPDEPWVVQLGSWFHD